MAEKTKQEETEDNTWETSFDGYHKQREFEPGKPFLGLVEDVYRASSEAIHIELEINEVDWVVALPCPEITAEAPPDELFTWPEESEYADLIVFILDVLVPRNENFSSLIDKELKVELGEEFDTVKIDGVDHEFDIRRQDEDVNREAIRKPEDELVTLISAYFEEGGRGIETTLQLDPLLEDEDRFQVSAPLTPYYTATWEFDLSKIVPDREKDSVYRFIESAGGDPEFVAGTHAHVIHYTEDSYGLEEVQIVGIDTTGTWALLLPEDYEEWKEMRERVEGNTTATELPTFSSEYATKIVLLYEGSVGLLAIYTFSILALFNTLISPDAGILRTLLLMGWAFFFALVVLMYGAQRLLTPSSDDSD